MSDQQDQLDETGPPAFYLDGTWYLVTAVPNRPRPPSYSDVKNALKKSLRSNDDIQIFTLTPSRQQGTIQEVFVGGSNAGFVPLGVIAQGDPD